MEYDDELERARARSSRRKTERRKKSWKKEQDPLKMDDIELRSSLKSGKSRNQKWRQDDKKKRRIKIIIAEVVVLLLVVAIGAFAYVKSLWGRMATLDWDPDNVANPYLTVEQQEQMKGYWTIACFGVDSRDMSLGKGTNADVNIICNINRDTGEIRLVSVFRDTFLNINDKNSYNKINAAYAQGGPEQAVKALNKNLDLAIDDYATFNWAAVAQAINLLGGVDIELSDNEFSFINAFITEVVENTGIPSVQLTHAGLNHLDGVQAVAYGRLRLGDTDFARTERQRIVLEKAFDKAKSADWATLKRHSGSWYSPTSPPASRWRSWFRFCGISRISTSARPPDSPWPAATWMWARWETASSRRPWRATCRSSISSCLTRRITRCPRL